MCKKINNLFADLRKFSVRKQRMGPQITKMDWAWKSHIPKRPHLQKVCWPKKFADLRLRSFYPDRPPLLILHIVQSQKRINLVRHRPGPEWGTWGNPQELNWFLPLIKPLRRTRSLRDPAQTQVWSEQVWLDTTFISQGFRSWGKLAVKTWRVKTELIIITILHITTTTTSILNLGFKTIAPKIQGGSDKSGTLSMLHNRNKK